MTSLPAQKTALEDFTPDKLSEEEKEIRKMIEILQPVTIEEIAKKEETPYHQIEGIFQQLQEKNEIKRTDWIKNRYGNKTPRYEVLEK